MEYVPQGSLAACLHGRPHPVPQALGLVEQIAVIVSYIHRQGVVHGNLKPTNVMLAASGIPRLADFRVADGAFHRPGALDDSLSASLGYLSPELVAGTATEPRPYTDVYGLGILLYELLTGRAPFAGGTVQEVLERVRGEDPPPPSALNPAVTPPLDRLCLRCLRKNPWRRFVRAYDLFTLLRQVAAETPEHHSRGGRPPGR
jgi:serine/threonine protein kinase